MVNCFFLEFVSTEKAWEGSKVSKLEMLGYVVLEKIVLKLTQKIEFFRLEVVMLVVKLFVGHEKREKR